MRDMNDEERKVFDAKMDYIAKLKDSMTQEELDGLLPKEVTDRLDAPKFDFGDARFYPKEEFNDYLASAYSGSPVSETLKELRRRVGELEVELDTTRAETDGYVAEIERLEKDLKSTREELYRDTVDHDLRKADAPEMTRVMKEFPQWEFVTFMMQMTLTWMQNHRPQTPTENLRTHQLAKCLRDSLMDTYDVKRAERESSAFKAMLEGAVDKCFDKEKTDIAPLVAIGFRDRTRKNSPHWKVAWEGMDDYTFIVPKTPSDSRAVENCKKAMVQRLCI